MTQPAIQRPSPLHKPVSLFVTCMVDALYPAVGVATVRLLEHIGLDVRFPMAQTCCGQPAYNAGYHAETRQVARQFLRAFADAELIVVPSGSCASMVQHSYPALFEEDDPALYQEAVRVASITWELTEFLVDGLNRPDLGLALAAPQTVAFHDACHGLRLSGLTTQGRQLAGAVQGATLVEMPESDVCCGFGGLFSVKMADVSGAMLRRKLGAVEAAPPVDAVLTGDAGCMAHINGGRTRGGQTPIVQHIAEFLASGL